MVYTAKAIGRVNAFLSRYGIPHQPATPSAASEHPPRTLVWNSTTRRKNVGGSVGPQFIAGRSKGGDRPPLTPLDNLTPKSDF